MSLARFVLVAVAVVSLTTPTSADIYRWDNGAVIPGTEGITPGPGVQLDHRELEFADLRSVDFSAANLTASNLTKASFAGANLSNASLLRSNLTGAILGAGGGGGSRGPVNLWHADFTDAIISNATLVHATLNGFTESQLRSTASYQNRTLIGTVWVSFFGGNQLAGWNFSHQDLTDAVFGADAGMQVNLSAASFYNANLTRANLSNTLLVKTELIGAEISGANFAGSTLTAEQLYNTSSYSRANLSGVGLASLNLNGWEFNGQNLSYANLASSVLANAKFVDATIVGTLLSSTGITAGQMYSTSSYRNKDLREIVLADNNLADWDFSGQNLVGSSFVRAIVANADFSLADLRGASFSPEATTRIRNTILPDGTINGLNLTAGEKLVAFPDVPIPVSITGGYSIATDATLNLTDNAAIVGYTGTSPVLTVREQTISGRGGTGLGGAWTGTGITSSTAAAANETDADSRSLGYAENAALSLGPYTTFHGAAVDDTSILIAFTRTGDANLDGFVNDDDVTIVGATYAPGEPNPSWALGDFDYNGFVDDDDVTLLGAFYDPSAPPLAVSPTAATNQVSAVPEPSTVTLLGVMLAGLAIVVVRRRYR